MGTAGVSRSVAFGVHGASGRRQGLESSGEALELITRIEKARAQDSFNVG